MSILKVNDIRRATTGSAALVINDPVIITTGSISASVLIGSLPGAVTIGDGTIGKEKLTNDARDWVNILNKPSGLLSSSAQIPGAVSGSSINPTTVTASVAVITKGYFSGSGEYLYNIPNSALNNSSITINGVATALGTSRTLVTADVSESINLYYTDARVKSKLNADGVISSSGQVNYQSVLGQFSVNTLGSDGNNSFTVSAGIFITGSTGIDITTDSANAKITLKTVGGTVSSSAQVKANLPADTISSSTQVKTFLPADTVSSSTQVIAFLPTDTVSSSIQINTGSFSGSFTGTILANNNVVSSSTQVKTFLPADTVSSSTQVKTFLPADTVSSSTQVIAFLPTDTVSSSVQVKAFLPGGSVSSSIQTIDNITAQNINPAQITASGHIIPSVSNTIDLGTPTAKFRDLYLSGSTLYLGTLAIKDVNGTLVVTTSGSSTPSPVSGSYTGSFTGSFGGTFPYASLTGIPSGIASGSAQIKDYLPIDTISSSVQVKAFLPGGSVSASNQVDVRNTTGIATIATTGSNTFIGNQTISGSVTLTGNLQVFGTSSTLYVTSSQLDIGSNKIIVNTTDALRFGGLTVIDSGSVGNLSGSLYWDALNNHWIYENVSGSGYNSAILIAGPKHTGSLGAEPVLTIGKIPVASGDDHIADSNISDINDTVGIATNLKVTGSITASFISGALTGTFPYASLTGIPSGIASGSEQIKIYLPADTVSSSIQVKAFLPNGTVSASAQYPGWVTASSQIDYNSITNKLSGVVSSSTQIQPLLPSGTVSASTQVKVYLPDGTVSSSGQVDVRNTTGIATLATTGSNTFIGNQTISGSLSTSGSFNTNADTLIFDGTMSVSGALATTGSVRNTAGGFTGSFTGSFAGTFPYASLTGIPSSMVSSSTQVTTLLPAGTVSSSGQISATSTTGFTTGVEQVMKDNNVHSGSFLGTATTNNLSEGFTNLYYTDARVKTKLNVEAVHSGSSLGTATTTNLAEGTNLYFTNVRVLNALPINTVSSSNQVNAFLPAGTVSSSAQINLSQAFSTASQALTASYAITSLGTTATSTDGLPEGSTNLYYTDARVKTKLNADSIHSGSFLGTATTTNLTEGINLYFTNPRVVNALPIGTVSSSGQVDYNSITNKLSGVYSSSTQAIAAIAGQSIAPSTINAMGAISGASIRTFGGTASFAADDYGKVEITPTTGDGGSAVIRQYTNSPRSGGNLIIQVDGNAGGGNLIFSTNYAGAGTERVRIDSIGNVGIGTSSPNQKLAVNGNTNITGSLDVTGAISGASIQTSGNGIFLGNVGIGTTTPYSQLHLTDTVTMGLGGNARPAFKVTNWGYSTSYRALLIGSPSTQYAHQNTGSVTIAFNYDPSINTNSAFNGDGREIIFRNGTQFVTPNAANTSFNLYNLVLVDDKVGIRTGTPDASLDVRGDFKVSNANGGGGMVIGSGSGPTEYQYLNFGGNATGQDAWQIGKKNNVSDSVGPDKGFYIYDLKTSAARLVIASGSGNVGIGTTSPVTNFEVRGIIASSISNFTYSTFDGFTDGNLYITANAGSANTTSSNIIFRSSTSGGSITERVRIDNSGNVGIGTATPNAKLDINGNVIVTGSLTVTGRTEIAQVREKLNTKTGATGTVTHDYSTGAIFYHSSIAANFTINLTNVPTDNDKTIAITVILNQGVTGYYPSAFQIDGSAQTLRWANNETPTPSTSKVDVATFSLIRTGGAWIVLGNYTPFA